MDGGGGPIAAVGVRAERPHQVESHRASSSGARRKGPQRQAVQVEVLPPTYRYVTRIDTSHPKEDWPRHDELRLF